jgi:hypothetical protein
MTTYASFSIGRYAGEVKLILHYANAQVTNLHFHYYLFMYV